MLSFLPPALLPYAPILFLATATLLLLVARVVVKNGSASLPMTALPTSLIIAVTIALVYAQPFVNVPLLTSDAFGQTFTLLMLTAALGAVFLSVAYEQAEPTRQFEFYILLLLASVGMMLMLSATDLLSLYIGIELQSLSLYVLAALRRDTLKSTEAGLKYFVLGALSSGLLLYGISLVYGALGTTDYNTMLIAAGQLTQPSAMLVVGIVFILCGIAFKLSAAPFHMWTPDVYQGAPTSVTAFFAVAPKVAAVGALLRLLYVGFAENADTWQQIMIVLAALSMLVGTFGALRQQNIKRLLAYSSIGHIGFMLMAISVNKDTGIAAVLFYLLVYAVMNVGAFGCVLSMRKNGQYVDSIRDLAGVSKTNPLFAYSLAIFMLSMAGIPIFAGFLSKLYVFQVVLDAKLYTLAIIGVLSSVVAAVYYLRVCKVMFFDANESPLDNFPCPVTKTIVITAAVVNTVFIAYPAPQVFAFCQRWVETLQ
jgi:NADH-quinone oxidoreductase subunit N